MGKIKVRRTPNYPGIKDKTNSNLNLLDTIPAGNNRDTFVKFINAINASGWDVVITSANRTYQEQWNLKYGPGGDRRNAEPGYSKHEKGKAIDINCIKRSTRLHLGSKKISTIEQWEKSGIPQIAATFKIKWGGTAFGSRYPDFVHFEIITEKYIGDPLPGGQLVTEQPDYLDEDVDTPRNTKTVILHKGPPIKVEDFIKQYDIRKSPNAGDYFSNQELIDFGDNEFSILNALGVNTKMRIDADDNGITVINTGTRIEIPVENLGNKTIYAVNKNLVLNNDVNCFIGENIKNLIENIGYKRLNLKKSDSLNGTIYKRFLNCSVYLFSKSIGLGDTNNLDGKFINLTPFVQQMQTNVGKSGGSFSITLPHVSFENLREFENAFDNLDGFLHKNIMSVVKNKSDYTTKRTVLTVTDEDDSTTKYYKRNKSFFNKNIQNQDLIFIRFEQLSGEKRSINSSPYLNPSDLDGIIFDMIGLVDKVSISANPTGQTVSITGMDLSKLLVDDGVFFFPVMFGTKDAGVYLKQTHINGTANKLILDGRVVEGTPSQFEYGIENKVISNNLDIFNFTGSIREWLMFMFAQMTSIEVIPDNVLSGYAGKNKTFIIQKGDTGEENTDTYSFIPASGIWQICKLVIDKSLDNRRLADTSIASSTGTLLDMVKKVIQDPFIELNMDTWGTETKNGMISQYIFMVRKSPFSSEAFKTIPCVNIYEDQVVQDSLEWCDEIYTMFQLTPKGNGLLSADSATSLLALPVVMVNQYVAIWGAKLLNITTNYLDFDPVVSADYRIILNQALTQSLQDMDWLINAFAYMPFTRQGSITIKRDRRIKRGMIIRYYPTGELFYVVAVTNTLTFEGQTDGFTILQVQRGIVEAHYEKYFNLISRKGTYDNGVVEKTAEDKTKADGGFTSVKDLAVSDKTKDITNLPFSTAAPITAPLLKEETILGTGSTTETAKTINNVFNDIEWKLNSDNFNFLLQRRQIK